MSHEYDFSDALLFRLHGLHLSVLLSLCWTFTISSSGGKYKFSITWVRLWAFKLHTRVKVLWQMSHVKGFSVFLSLSLLRCLEVLKAFVWTAEMDDGLLPTWACLCTIRLPSRTNRLQHRSQEYVFSVLDILSDKVMYWSYGFWCSVSQSVCCTRTRFSVLLNVSPTLCKWLDSRLRNTSSLSSFTSSTFSP